MTQSILMLVLSIVALLLGPAVYWLAQKAHWPRPLVDGFCFVTIAGLVVVYALPEAFELAGWASIAAAVVGFVGPSMFERWMHRGATRAHTVALVLGMSGIAVHAMLDGAAIGMVTTPLAVAVVLHRLPVSLTVCLLLVSRRRWRAAWGALFMIALMTGLGFVMREQLPSDGSVGFGMFEGLVAGALLHVVFHRTDRLIIPGRSGPLLAGIGGLFGVAVLIGLGQHHHHHDSLSELQVDTFEVLLRLTAESAPALLLAYLGAGLLDAFMPRATVNWMRRGSALSQSLRGVSFGLPLPICSCGVIPLYRGLVLKGTPAAAAMAFLVATPEIGIDAILLSLPLLGTELTIVRVLCAAIVAITAGWLLGRVVKPSAQAEPSQQQIAADKPLKARIRQALAAGLGDMVDNTGPWIALGLGIAAVGAGSIHGSWLAAAAPWDIPLLALLGIPIYVCASGATPLVAMLIFKGVSPGAAIAFLLTGPATNATTFGVLSRLHGGKVAALFGALVASMAIGLGYVVNTVLPTVAVFPLSGGHDHHSIPAWRWVCVALFAALLIGSILRQGPRGFVAHVFKIADEKKGANDSGHDHDHGHSCCGH